MGDATREAIAESRVFLIILSPSGLTPSMTIEIGAAQAWDKPISAVVTDPSSTRLPTWLTGIPLYTTGRLEDVIKAIKLSINELTEEDRIRLAKIFANIGMSVDELALNPRRLGDLVKRFNAGRDNAVSGECLLFGTPQTAASKASWSRIALPVDRPPNIESAWAWCPGWAQPPRRHTVAGFLWGA